MEYFPSSTRACRASAGMASEHCQNVAEIELALHKGKVSPFIVCLLILRWKNVNLCYKWSLHRNHANLKTLFRTNHVEVSSSLRFSFPPVNLCYIWNFEPLRLVVNFSTRTVRIINSISEGNASETLLLYNLTMLLQGQEIWWYEQMTKMLADSAKDGNEHLWGVTFGRD